MALSFSLSACTLQTWHGWNVPNHLALHPSCVVKKGDTLDCFCFTPMTAVYFVKFCVQVVMQSYYVICKCPSWIRCPSPTPLRTPTSYFIGARNSPGSTGSPTHAPLTSPSPMLVNIDGSWDPARYQNTHCRGIKPLPSTGSKWATTLMYCLESFGD